MPKVNSLQAGAANRWGVVRKLETAVDGNIRIVEHINGLLMTINEKNLILIASPKLSFMLIS